MPNQVKLTNGAATLLRSVLNVPDALSTLKDKFAAGCLLATTLEEIPAVPKDEAEAKAWVLAEWREVELSNAQMEACKAAVNKTIDKLPAGAVTNALITALGLAPD